ncbi:MAG TPA: tripartite tricarboxylate transporter substrate-binding protein [Candidatus Binatia bacterium]|jgi:tripartite-type tricarboxylate transporter receptor subunit TctC
MRKTFFLAMIIVAGSLLLLAVAPAVSSADEFFNGKTIDIIVGFSPGGGYDLAARTLARHLGDHIPGHPNVIVENRTGAGGLLAANQLFYKTEPDGLTLGTMDGGAYALDSVLGERSIKFDSRKFGWIGTEAPATPVCAIMGFTGLKNLQDILNSGRQLRMGATRTGSTPADLPKILNWALDTKFDVITGYKGTSRIRLAMQRHEMDGACWTWESMRTTGRTMLNAKGEDQLIPFIIAKKWNDPEVRDIPLIPEVIKNPEKLAGYKAWVAKYEFEHPFMTPPGIPQERLEVLQEAFKATVQDPKFLADAKKSNLYIDYVSPEVIHEGLDHIYSLSAKLKKELQFLLPPRKVA